MVQELHLIRNDSEIKRWATAWGKRSYAVCKAQERIKGFHKPETPIMAIDQPNAVINAWWGFTEVSESLLLSVDEEDISLPFFASFRKNKCLVLVNGFYLKLGESEFLFQKSNQKIFMLSAIYRDFFNPVKNETDRQFILLTRRAKGIIKDLGDNHTKIPIALFDKKQWADFLDSGCSSANIDFICSEV